MSVKSPYDAGIRPYVWDKVVIAEDSRPAPEIGENRTFVPAAFDEGYQGSRLSSIRPDVDLAVTGTVVYVNETHRWFRVRYETPDGGVQHESFKY